MVMCGLTVLLLPRDCGKFTENVLGRGSFFSQGLSGGLSGRRAGSTGPEEP